MSKDWLLRAMFAASLIFACDLSAQVAGRLSGSVVDPTGAAVPNATVRLFLAGGTTPIISTTTTEEGLFNLATIRPDYYDLKIEASGFQTKTLARVKVDPSKETSLPAVNLDLSTAAEVIEVRESSAAVQTSSAEVTTTITRSQVENLPVFDRQVTNLFITQAGVANSRTATTINGLRPAYSNLLLDGVNIQDTVRTNSLDYVPNRLTIGLISELTIAAANANPTLGGNANTISLTTPSGENTFHGSLFWFNRNSHFAANDWFNNQSGVERPRLNLNQLGGSFSGPIIKDKLLFYFVHEAYRLRQQSPTPLTILTPSARRGIFTYNDATTGQPRQFNILQAQGLSIDPFMQSLIDRMPENGNFTGLGNQRNTTGYTFNARDNTTRDNTLGKVDFYLNERNHLSGSYSWNRDVVDRPDVGTFYTPEPPIFNDQNAKFMSASWRWSPTPTLTNELRGGFNLPFGSFRRRTPVPEFFASNASLIFDSPEAEDLPEERTIRSISIQDNANWVKGRHAVSFGFQANLWQQPAVDYQGVTPSYTLGLGSSPFGFRPGDIPGASTNDIGEANQLLASLAGLVSGFSQTFNIEDRQSGFVPGAPQRFEMRMNNYAPYISDTWKLARRLTLSLGLRWEYFSTVDEVSSLAIQPRIEGGNVLNALLGNPTLDFAGASAGRPLYDRDLNNWAPNVGLAWDIFGNGNTVFRGGYMIAYANDNLINSIYNTFTVNQGLTSSLALANLSGRISGGRPVVTTPTFTIPTTLEAQFNLTPSSPPVQGIIDPKLKVPYVQQWNFGLEQQMRGGFVASARFVGNHTVGQFRQIDYNQIDPTRGGFLEDFKRARNNAFLALAATNTFDPRYNPNIAGSQQLPFFNSLPSGGFLTNATVAQNIRRGEPGSLAQVYQTSGILPSDDFSFFPNPLALYSSLLTNVAHSTYNSGQFELTRRARSGAIVQANYTFSKAFSNAGAFRGLEAQLDNNNPGLERARATYDLTHAIKVNHVIPLPFGRGRRFHIENGFLNQVLGGWTLGGFMTLQSGSPVSFLSNRGTLNRGARSIGVNTASVNVDGQTLREATGLFKTGDGVYFVNPRHIGPDGRGVAADGAAPFEGQLFFNPGPGEVGNLQRRYLDGPWYRNYDASLAKTFTIGERHSFMLRAEAFNLFNNPNFWPSYDSAAPDHDINSVNFGRITSQYYSGNGVGPRNLQFSLRYSF